MTDLSKVIANLSPEQQELLLRRLGKLQRESPATPPDRIPPQPRTTNRFPLSFAQQRLWFLDQLEPGSARYNIPLALRLTGSVDVATLERCYHTIIQRHEALRTIFAVATPGGEPVQIIVPLQPQPLPIVDLSTLPPAIREAEVQQRAIAEASQPFDLSTGPLLRATLLHLGPAEHVLLLNMHHIISDGWSLGVLVRELMTLYTTGGSGSALPALPIQYADYAVWQRQRLAPGAPGDRHDRQLAYWQQQLGPAGTGSLPVLDLPLDHPRPARQTLHGAVEHLAQPLPLAALTKLSSEAGTTLFMTLLAAFYTLLYHYTHQEDLLVGTPIAGRQQGETEGLIGFFVNTLVMRTQLRGDLRFRELLARVREVAFQAYAHQDLPFELLVEELGVERDLSLSPLFQVMFILQNTPLPVLKLPRLTLTPIEAENNTAKFDLTLDIYEENEQLLGLFEYNTDLFDRTTIARMGEHWQRLLADIVAAPDRRLDDISLIGSAERQQLLREWNATSSHYPRLSTIHSLFEQQVERTPDAIAVADHRPPTTDHRQDDKMTRWPDDKMTPLATHNTQHATRNTLTYAELNARANRLAHYLRGLGVGPETPVGICMERSPELIIAQLGVLKAGGAYVSLDPAAPPERLQYMLEDARVPVLLTDKEIGDWRLEIDATQQSPISNLQSPIRIDLIADWDRMAQESATNLDGGATADHLAYVIYTSGSTGRPKGVQIAHGGLTNLATWHQRTYQVTSADRTMQIASPAFDASVWEIWPYLTAGASLHLPDEDTRSAPARLAGWLRDRAITIGFLPTALAEAVLNQPWPGGAALRALLVGGDQLHQAPPAGLPFELYNHYGPTENTVVATAAHIAAGTSDTRVPPIGRPIANVQVYLLDGRMQPVPIGVAGELYIGGDGLARGYLHRPDLTAERFVPNPFAQEGLEIRDWRLSGAHSPISNLQSPISSRLYRTGDLCRYLPDGNIEFLGRIDGQVKLRGFRIELGEIEAVLEQHDAVRQAVVLAHEVRLGEKRLIAYVVPGDWRLEIGDSASDNLQSPISNLQTELRQFLRDRLPDYMIPSVFVPLDALPLTPNGKIDRKALPAPDQIERAPDLPSIAARTPTEALLANLWADVLDVPQIGLDDNFFVLGGHSLLATQLIARVRDTFHIDIPVRTLFETPTIAGLAKSIDAERQRQQLPTPPVEPVDRTGPLPLSFAQQRLWFIDQFLPGSAAYNITIAIRLAGSLDRDALARSLNELVRRHESLRTIFPRGISAGAPGSETQTPVQIIMPAADLALPLIDLGPAPTQARARDMAALLAEEAQRPFDLSRGPLLRAMLIRHQPEEHELLLSMHHIIIDGWSMNILVRELAALYRSFGQPDASTIVLPAPTIQYGDYAVWQRQWFQGDALDAELDYWRRQLRGVDSEVGDQRLPVLNLPLDHPRPTVQTFGGGSETLLLAPALVEDLRTLSRRESVTLFMTLLAAFDVLLYRYTGQTDLLVGTPIAGRVRPELEGIVGLFVNTLVIRANLTPGLSFSELLAQVRDTTLSAFDHQALPFERLVEEIQPERDPSRSPVFQVMFNMLNFSEVALDLPGLQISFSDPPPSAQFDLTLTLLEDPSGLFATFTYNADLFEAATIARMGQHWQQLLADIVAAPDRRLDDLGLIGSAERHLLLLEWNATSCHYPRHATIHSLFEQQVVRTPDAIALVFDHSCLTYSELNLRANQLAHYLLTLGVGPETPVGVYLERSLEQIVALLAILKAGGAYLPLDPSYPAERLQYMLADAHVLVLLTSKEIRDWRLEIGERHQSPISNLQSPSPISNLQSPAMIDLVADWPLIAGLPHTTPDSRVTSDNLAYICYTSGSTGTPKGVSVVHHNVVRLAHQPNYASLTARERVLQFAPLAFDAATFEIWAALLNGAQLLIFPPHQPSLEELGRFIQHRQLTTLWLTAGLFHQIVDHQLAALRDVRQLLAGGDVLSVPRAERLLAELPSCRLINGYGPTENTTFTCCYPVSQPQALERSVPIGRPIAHTQVYILDGRMQPVPIGVTGELYIGGDGLARGYLGRPDLTAERFVPNPFAQEGLEIRDWRLSGAHSLISNLQSPISSRLYRTGDLCRYQSDGSIEFLGRIDGQVKLRGFRIELGEIEAVLEQHDAVRQALVLARNPDAGRGEDRVGEKRLIAYVVSGDWRLEIGDSAFDNLQSPISNLQTELRQFLRDRLPDYMIPSAFVPLDALPLTPNGKIDRKALPAPEFTQSDTLNYVAPQTPTEVALAAICAEVLGVDRVGLHDNFFELGGHSLLVLQVVSRLRQTLEVEVPVSALFTTQTIAALAQHIDVIQWAANSQAAVTQPIGIGEEGEL